MPAWSKFIFCPIFINCFTWRFMINLLDTNNSIGLVMPCYNKSYIPVILEWKSQLLTVLCIYMFLIFRLSSFKSYPLNQLFSLVTSGYGFQRQDSSWCQPCFRPAFEQPAELFINSFCYFRIHVRHLFMVTCNLKFFATHKLEIMKFFEIGLSAYTCKHTYMCSLLSRRNYLDL